MLERYQVMRSKTVTTVGRIERTRAKPGVPTAKNREPRISGIMKIVGVLIYCQIP